MAGAIALKAAIDWYSQFDRGEVEAHMHHLQTLTYQAMSKMEDIRVLGYQPDASILSVVMEGVHHQDLATLLDQQGIAVRAGHHCAHPLMEAFGVKGTVRISFGIYNSEQEVAQLIKAIEKAVDIL